MFPAVSFDIPTVWRVKGQLPDVARLLTTPKDFPLWWGDVYLSVTELTAGDAKGIGQTMAIHSRGWLPYHLHWQATLTEADLPHRWSLSATGDLTGQGIWTLRQSGPIVEARFDWQVTSDRLLFRVLGPLLKGVMVSNHQWAMAKGEAALQRALHVPSPANPPPVRQS